MTPRTLNNQDGIALGPILFIIAILAILAAAIAAGAGGFTANTSAEQAKSNAEALVQYADQLKMAVQKVMANNSCSDTQLQFQGSNPNAPSDGSCNIFDPRGGGIVDMSFVNLNAAFNMTQATSHSGWWGTFGHFTEGSNAFIENIGPNTPLIFMIYDLTLNTCAAINAIVQYNPPTFTPPSPAMGVYPGFNGSYGAIGNFNLGFSSSGNQGCIYDSGYNEYDYVGVLLAR
ncbi:MAG TPA: hypothetical protein VIF88_14390 [Methylocystis sp.]|jgi:type II secretory pathway pseudopilin PulG